MVNKFIIDVKSPTIKFPKIWQTCVGSCHAALGLRSDWQEHLKFVHDELGFKYVRFHGLLNDDMKIMVCLKDFIGLAPKIAVTVNFYQIDLLFDYILKIGMKPFVELSFMPKLLASGRRTIFYYKGNITPPKRYEKWAELIKSLIIHLIERYGKEEIESWFFEVWNEPNLKVFWSSSQKKYFKLYKFTAEAIKSIDPNIKVGGPATACNAWISDFIQFCKVNKVPFDFISTHQYPSDIGLKTNLIKSIKQFFHLVKISKEHDLHYFLSNLMESNMMDALGRAGRDSMKNMTIKARQEAKLYPLYYTEWNSNSACSISINDLPYTSALIIKAVVDVNPNVDIYSFWCFSDIFEELTFFSKPFNGVFGLVTIHGIPKPSFWAFKFLSKMSEERIDIPTKCESETLEMIATKQDKGINILLYNHQAGNNPINDEEVHITLNNIEQVESVYVERIDEDHGNPIKFWKEMDSQTYLKKEDIELIKDKSRVVLEKIDFEQSNGKVVLNLVVPKHGVALISIITVVK